MIKDYFYKEKHMDWNINWIDVILIAAVIVQQIQLNEMRWHVKELETKVPS